jgi:hypothetical protein
MVLCTHMCSLTLVMWCSVLSQDPAIRRPPADVVPYPWNRNTSQDKPDFLLSCLSMVSCYQPQKAHKHTGRVFLPTYLCGLALFSLTRMPGHLSHRGQPCPFFRRKLKHLLCHCLYCSCICEMYVVFPCLESWQCCGYLYLALTAFSPGLELLGAVPYLFYHVLSPWQLG